MVEVVATLKTARREIPNGYKRVQHSCEEEGMWDARMGKDYRSLY
jgi:hypothetical protein